MQNIDPYYARHSFESLLIQQSHIKFDGLWTDGINYYAVCPELQSNPRTSDDELLMDWFNSKCRVVSCPIELISEAPINTIPVQVRTAEELTQLHGEPLTATDVFRELSSMLPLDFPLSAITNSKGSVNVIISRQLTEDERNQLDISIGLMNVCFEINVVVSDDTTNLDNNPTISSYNISPLAQLSSQIVKRFAPRKLTELYHEDEEFWVDNRSKVFTDVSIDSSSILPIGFKRGNSCFIDATSFTPNNIRGLLPIYNRIIIAPPIETNCHELFKGLGINESELIELVHRGRIQFALPQPINRYPIKLLSDAYSANSSSLILTRRLAAASIAQTKKSFPFLYPGFGAVERISFLESLSTVKGTRFDNISDAIRNNLGRMWVGMESTISSRGAMGTARNGISPIISDIIKTTTGKDVELEIITSSMAVEWSVALNSTYCPINGNGFSDEPFANLIASLYSGVPNEPVLLNTRTLDKFATGLLAIENDASILDLEKSFSNSDINRIRKIFSAALSAEDVDDYIRSFNKKIVEFENNQTRLSRIDIMALLGALGSPILAGNPNIPIQYIPFGIWFLKYVLVNADPAKDFGGRFIDWIRAVNSLTSTNAVFIGRIRKQRTT